MGPFDLRFVSAVDGMVLPLLTMIHVAWEREAEATHSLKPNQYENERVAYRNVMRAMMRFDTDWCRYSQGANLHAEDRIDQLEARYGVPLDGVWSEWIKTLLSGGPLRVVIRCTDAQIRELRNALTPWVKLERQGGKR